MLLSNAYRPDPRVQREARALADAGYRVTIICWDRQAEFQERQSLDGVEIRRVRTVRSAYGSGWRQLFYLPRFWRQAQRLAQELRPDIVHCHDLDTLYVGWRLKSQLGRLLVYDAHEHYPALMSLYLPKPLVRALSIFERRLMQRVDVTITASTVLRDEYLTLGFRQAVTLGNYAELAPFAAVTDTQVDALRSKLAVSSDDLLVAYIGGFSRNRMLLPWIEAAAQLPAVRFHLWGDGLQRPEIELAVERHPNVYYHGWLAPGDLPRHFKAADIIYYCLRLDYPGAVYNAPNTLSNAMAAGRPIIANDVGDLGRIVRTAKCGVLIDEATPQAIVDAIARLRDPGLRARLGNNALQAAKSEYNATAVTRQIVELYSGWLD